MKCHVILSLMNERNFETPYVELRDKSDQCVSERDLQIKETSCDSELESMAARDSPHRKTEEGQKTREGWRFW
jgi:hypothetical protein